MKLSKDTQPLFPNHVLHAMNALQYLRACFIFSESLPGAPRLYESSDDIANAINAPAESLPRVLRALKSAGVISTKMGPEGGYHISAQALGKYKVVDVLKALGRDIPDNGHVRASDRLNVTVLDCLSMTLDDFFN